MPTILITYALHAEKVELNHEGTNFVYCKTGIGKVDAAIRAQKAIFSHRPDVVVNIGTCGSIHHEIGSTHICKTFIDRDMEKLVEFGLVCEQNFDEELAQVPGIKNWNFASTCNTGDTFLTSKDGTGDVFDMEAYAIAKVCKSEQLPLVAIKCVTDIIGQNSVKHWEDKLQEAQETLQGLVNTLNFTE